MNVRQRFLLDQKFSCDMCGKRVTDADNAVNMPAKPGALAYNHKTCGGSKMAKSNAVRKEVEIPAKKTAKKIAKKKLPAKKLAAKKAKKPSSWVSKSGTYSSLRHLMETILSKNHDASYDDTLAIMKKEYPDRLAHWNAKHFGWFKTQIVTHKKIKDR